MSNADVDCIITGQNGICVRNTVERRNEGKRGERERERNAAEYIIQLFTSSPLAER